MSSRRLFAVAFVLLAGVFALHAYRYFPFLTDAALDSLHYSKRLANGGGLTWSDGSRVEGYTNFLWVLLNGFFAKLGLDVITSARALGFAGVLLAVASVGLEPRRNGVSLPRLVVGGLFMVATVPLAIWSIGALEQGLVVGLVALALRLLDRSTELTDRRQLLISGVPLALVVLLRAEGFVLALAMFAAAACLPRPSVSSLRRSAVAAIPSGAALLLQTGFRLVYYGDFLPAPARVEKEGRFASGVDYVASGYALASMLVLFAVVATVLTFRRGERFRLLLPWSVVIASTLTAVVGGGEPLPGHRELLPALVALCFVVADEVADDWARIATQRVLVLPIIALCAFLHVTQGSEAADSRRAKNERTVLHALGVGSTLHGSFGAKRPLLLVESPGALAFGADLPSIELSGVHSATFERADAVLKQAPMLVVFGGGAGKPEPSSALGLELVRSKRFVERYQLLNIEGAPRDEEVGQVWVRRERGTLGIVRENDRLEIPGYFFSSAASRSSAYLEREGVLVAELTARAPGVLPELEVPAGTYRLDVTPRGAKPLADVLCRHASMEGFAPAGETIFEADGKTPVTLVLAPAENARALRLRSVTLTRIPGTGGARRCVPSARPLRVQAASVAAPKSEKQLWSHPSHVTFARGGLVVEFGEVAAVGGVEVSLSPNDAYALELRQDGKVVWSTFIERKRKTRKFAVVTQRLELPKRLGAGRYELGVRPAKGESSSTLGHATFF